MPRHIRKPVRQKRQPMPERGYAILYRQGETNHCPACTRSNWTVGRQTSECAFCGCVLPLSTMAMVYGDMRVAV
ncbi:hypothetical protein HNQ99_002653 [Rhizorhapis suberifaciens]|uniref:Uncharacterized protein n=1 Tax=Rhizorhapis suberifaciens TaxID=13656 RepID=A0A840HXT4_9SPHN|nr:hypothetical protein [Rhizorhapis suberifaciens]